MEKIFIIHAVSCRRRSLDANKISYFLSKNGYELVNRPQNADIIIFVTCAFIDKVVDYCIEKIKKFQKYDAELIVAGCLPAIEPKKLSKIFNGRTLKTTEINEINSLFPETKVKFSEINDKNILFNNLNGNNPIEIFRNNIRKKKWIKNIYFKIEEHVIKNLIGANSFIYKIVIKRPFLIRISWGCSGNCSYCGIKKAIGDYKSKPIGECIREFKKGLGQGYKNFLLTTDDAGAYGTDIGSSFPELLEKIVNFDGDFTVGIESLKPVWIIKYLNEIKKNISSGKIGYIDCSFESGSDKILKSMNRYSDTEKIMKSLLDLKKENPHVLLTTEVIIGFPSETEEDFQKTLSFIKKINFNTVFLFQFECKTGTKAEKLNPKVSEGEILKRMKFAKKFLQNNGYNQIRIPKLDFSPFHKFLIFDKTN